MHIKYVHASNYGLCFTFLTPCSSYRLHATSHEWTRSEEKTAAAAVSVYAYAYGEDEKKLARGAELGGEPVVCGC